MSRYIIEPVPPGEIDKFEAEYPELGKWLRELTRKLKPEPWREIGDAAAKNPAFENSWINYDGGIDTAAFYKDLFGRVHLKGGIKIGSTGTDVFTLPVGYLPLATIQMPILQSAAAAGSYVSININGKVKVFGSNVSTYASLDGVSFRAGA